MATHAELFEKLKSLKKSDVHCIVADFVSYQGNEQTITVKLKNGLQLPGVRLKAAVDKKNEYYEISVPRAKSTVLIGQIGEASQAGEYYLIMASEYERFVWKADKNFLIIDDTGTTLKYAETELKMTNEGKLSLKKGFINLHETMEDLTKVIKALNIVVVGVAGPYPLTVSSAKISPANTLELESIWSKLDTLLTNN